MLLTRDTHIAMLAYVNCRPLSWTSGKNTTPGVRNYMYFRHTLLQTSYFRVLISWCVSLPYSKVTYGLGRICGHCVQGVGPS